VAEPSMLEEPAAGTEVPSKMDATVLPGADLPGAEPVPEISSDQPAEAGAEHPEALKPDPAEGQDDGSSAEPAEPQTSAERAVDALTPIPQAPPEGSGVGVPVLVGGEDLPADRR
jgi:hypothetical protein